jgi:Neuraminidase (sialidase)
MDDNDHALGQTIKVWKSTDEGASWTHLATPEPGGMWCWEPEFAISSDGKLQLYYSYAGTTMDMLQQNIVRRESSDGGVTWGNRVTAVGNTSNHVGMARVVKGGSTYYMAVEYYEDKGGVRVVKGTDGKTWSSVATAPAMDKDNDGWMFSTPAITYVNGALIGIGKRYADWHLPFPFYYDENDGKVVLYSKDGGKTWKEMAAPFQIQYNDDSSNWSPTLLPLSNTQLFMITNSDTSSAHRIMYDTGPISTP